ncbi:MAG: nucleotidyltransferase family protein [bacterium]|nr:nucleotidyltransferase family protein [bacterium]
MSIIEIQEKISPILRAYGIKKASIFGSVSRGDERPDSDVDLLVELGRPMDLYAYIDLQDEIEKKLQKKVDLITNKSLNKFIAPYILQELKTIYEG